LLGPSGVGKTTFADWLQANRNYHHVAVDRGDQPNGLVAEGFDELAGKLEQGDPAPFASELQKRAKAKVEKGCVLTFYSLVCQRD